ncbi:hypothetical protein QBC37DRAFT_127549 [Rhypophila decipiens]|uniref:Uncharacterized protein n=1 Tax=Rhypophila decipiens TaxID=261697 RepID=A0AAN7B9E8_9PEZI|nr:hypothetical protein QBC37DRAFT_127549 [Rhypophila decipiens]
MAQAPGAAPTGAPAATAPAAPNPPNPPAPSAWITEHSDVYLALQDKVISAAEMLDHLDSVRKAKNWPGIRKREFHIDSSEDDADVTVHADTAASATNSDSDEETASDYEADIYWATATLAGGHWDELWAPMWTHPKHRDLRRLKLEDFDSQGNPKKIRARLDLPQVLHRPALLPKDAARKPTLYAKRYGMDPDRPKGSRGRSRFSPMISATRRLKVVDPATGDRDPTRARVDFFVINDEINAKGGFGPFVQKLDTIKPDDEDYAKYMAIKKFLAISSDDVDYQRAIFYDLSTDERIQLKTADPEDPDPPPDSNLRGPLHPAFDYRHWRNHLKLPRPDDIDGYLKLNYALEGTEGTYRIRASDQRVWMAIQPMLQAASRIIEAHPAWGIICDPFLRRLVPESRVRDSGTSRKIELADGERPDPPDPKNVAGMRNRLRIASEWPVYIHIYEGDGIPMPDLHDEKAQRALKKWKEETDGVYDMGARAWDFLARHVQYQIGLSFGGDEGYDEIGGRSVCYGLTHESEINGKPKIVLGAWSIWPLLTPSYTHAEKGVQSKYLTSTFLHEFGHAVMAANRALATDYWLQKEPNLTDQAREAFRKIRWELITSPHGREHSEPHFGMEPEQEIGFALENQLWSGVPTCANIGNILEAFEEFDWMGMVAPSMNDWPREYWPSGDTGRPARVGMINFPKVPHHKFLRLTTVAEETKMFQQSFWDAEVAKKGTKALQPVAPGGGLMPTVRGNLVPPRRVFATMFDREVFGELQTAMQHLSNAGYSFSSMFIQEWMNELAEEAIIEEQMRAFLQLDTQMAAFMSKFLRPYARRMALAVKVMQVDLDHLLSPDHIKISAMSNELVMVDANNFQLANMDTVFQPPVNIREYRALVQSACRQVYAAVRETGPTIVGRAQHHLSEIQALFIHHMGLRRPSRARLNTGPDNKLLSMRARMDYFNRQLAAVRNTYTGAFNAISGLLGDSMRVPQLDTDDQYRVAKDLLPGLVGKMQAVIQGVADAWNVFTQAQSSTMEEGVSVFHTIPSFTSVPTRRWRRRKQLLKKAAMREAYKMPKRIREVFWHIVYVLGAAAQRVSNRDNNPEVDIEAEINEELERARTRLGPRDPLEQPTISERQYLDMTADIRRVPPPNPLAAYLIPAGAPQARNSRPPGPAVPADADPVNKLLPTGVKRKWVERLFGGKEVLDQFEQPNHPAPWVYKDGKTDANKKRRLIAAGIQWTPPNSSESELTSPPQSLVPEWDYEHSTDSYEEEEEDVDMTSLPPPPVDPTAPVVDADGDVNMPGSDEDAEGDEESDEIYDASDGGDDSGVYEDSDGDEDEDGDVVMD